MTNTTGRLALRAGRITFFFAVCTAALGCATPSQTQQYFVEESAGHAGLEPIYSTALYTVYFDHAVRRCILHAAHSWGQSGGGGGGTGLGVEAFRCDPALIRTRAAELGHEVYPPKLTLDRQGPTDPAGTPNETRGAK